MDLEALPPLNAIRAFEAAARSGSFAKAAAELHVTHWAIGKQVRLLEDWMGVCSGGDLAVSTSQKKAQNWPKTLAQCSLISWPRQKNYGIQRVRIAPQGSSELTCLRALLFAGLFLGCPNSGTIPEYKCSDFHDITQVQVHRKCV